MRRVYRAEIKAISSGDSMLAQFQIEGEAPNGGAIVFKIDARFSQWTCLAKSFRAAWQTERANRMQEIDRIDAMIPKEEAR